MGFKFGLPAKANMAGALVVVVPGVMGVCFFSPALHDHYHICTRGLRGLDLMSRVLNTHMFGNWRPHSTVLGADGNKGAACSGGAAAAAAFDNGDDALPMGELDVRLYRGCTREQDTCELLRAASTGDLTDVKRLHRRGVPLDSADYDGRTALHLAFAERRASVVQYVLDNGANPTARDRWGNIPCSPL